MKKVIIIGSGPAALTAAIYLCRANIKVTIVTGASVGGALVSAPLVENYPGFINGISGFNLIDNIINQTKKLGAKFIYSNVLLCNLIDRTLILDDGTKLYSDAILIATGSKYKKLNFKNENKFIGKGVSYCAVCDGAFFRNKDVCVIGGGDTALNDALFLSNLANKVYLIHRRDKFRASKILQKRVFESKNIELLLKKEIVQACGNSSVDKIILTDKTTVKTSAVFVAIGSIPSTNIFNGQLQMDNLGYIKTIGKSNKTSASFVFTAGDCTDIKYRQAIIAAGSGAKAAIDIIDTFEKI
jgi:thioredoxin reductase (NADPH)